MFRSSCGIVRVHEHDLACDAPSREQLMGTSRVGKRKPRDERLDRALPEKLEQREQILTKQRWPQPFQPLDAVRDHTLAARKNPAAGDVQTEDSDWTNTMATVRFGRSSLSLDRRRQTVGHHPSAGTERFS